VAHPAPPPLGRIERLGAPAACGGARSHRRCHLGVRCVQQQQAAAAQLLSVAKLAFGPLRFVLQRFRSGLCAVGRPLALSCPCQNTFYSRGFLPPLPSTAPQYDLRLRRQPRLCRSPRGFAGVAGKRAPFIAPCPCCVLCAEPPWLVFAGSPKKQMPYANIKPFSNQFSWEHCCSFAQAAACWSLGIAGS
jgi:hypothetical protein